jgi:hypothetical protein
VREEHIEAEEVIIKDALIAARKVQTFLWGEANGQWGLEEWRRMFRKRVAKMEEITEDRPHAHVELKKRLLQTAALSIALIRIIDEEGGLPKRAEGAPPSNLPKFTDPINDI